jgi:hypothetical protein
MPPSCAVPGSPETLKACPACRLGHVEGYPFSTYAWSNCMIMHNDRRASVENLQGLSIEGSIQEKEKDLTGASLRLLNSHGNCLGLCRLWCWRGDYFWLQWPL